MSFSEDNHLDLIVAGGDYVEPDQAMSEPGPTLELLGAVESPTDDTVSPEGMAPREGSKGELWIGEGPCQWPSCSSQAEELINALISDMHSTRSVMTPNCYAQEQRQNAGRGGFPCCYTHGHGHLIANGCLLEEFNFALGIEMRWAFNQRGH